ncbi:MAG: ABC transporter ATP-binding protein [Candidatus Bathyarchaeota archaeon]
MPSIELSEVSKHYGPTRALKGVTLSFEEGEAVAFLGPNGAGKSTLLKIIAAQIMPTCGKAKVLGFDTAKQPGLVKWNVGLVGHGSFMYDELTVEENLKFYGSFFNASPEDRDRVIETTALERWRGIKAGHLSFGLRKRSDIARALLSDPKVLVLDELFSGLDEEAADSLVNHLKSRRGQTLLVSSHSLEWVRKLCERGVYIRAGVVEKDVGF